MANTNATQRRNTDDLSSGQGLAYTKKVLVATVAMGGSETTSDTVTFGRIPSNARICMGEFHRDDLASSGAPTLDIGLFNVDSNITDDDDALNNGIDLATAGSGDVVNDHADCGQAAWEFVNGQTTDPGGDLIVMGTIKDAAINTAGDMTIQLEYYLD